MKKFIACALVAVLFAANLATQPSSANTAQPSTQTKQPNIVFILADDLDEVVMPYWDAMPQTAALLRDQGIQFTNAF